MGTLHCTPAVTHDPANTRPSQNVFKHKHTAHPSDPDPPSGLLDNLSDTLLNAFTKVKKPDERFVEMRAHLDQFEEGLAGIERLGARSKTRLADLSGDYEDLASSVQGLGYLESGITDPLMRFERALVDFGNGVREHATSASDPFLEHLHTLLAYSGAFKSVLKLRDQKQLDFEELSAYLANVVSERDRLAGGYGYGLGLGSYFKEKVESLRGGEADGSKEARLIRLDAKITEVSPQPLPAFAAWIICSAVSGLWREGGRLGRRPMFKWKHRRARHADLVWRSVSTAGGRGDQL